MTAPDPRLDAIARAHGGFVKSLALKLAPIPGAADDVAQQVFLEFLQKADTWDLASDVRPLLATMTRYVAARVWRERTQAMSPELRELAEHVARLSDQQGVAWYTDEEKEALRRCMDRLRADRLGGMVQWDLLRHGGALQPRYGHLDRHAHHGRSRCPRLSEGSMDRPRFHRLGRDFPRWYL